MKKIMILFIGFIMISSLTACTNTNKERNSDAITFKEEYESLNGTTSSSGKKIRSITIDEDNPIVYTTDSKIVEMVNNKETFVVYFGFAACPWCRSVINNLIDAAKDLEIDTIYYVDVLKIRDTIIVNEDDEVVTEARGSRDYYKLLETFDKVLSDYTIKNKNNETIKTNEKRIYAPNIISVVNGEVQTLTTGISEKQTDAYVLLTDEMKRESYNKIKCTIRCVANAKNSCSTDKMC